MGSKGTTDDARKIRTGMSREQVIAILGHPSKDVFVAMGDAMHEQWNVRDGTIAVYFDDAGFVDQTTIHVRGFVGQFFDDLYRWLFYRDAPDQLN